MGLLVADHPGDNGVENGIRDAVTQGAIIRKANDLGGQEHEQLALEAANVAQPGEQVR